MFVPAGPLLEWMGRTNRIPLALVARASLDRVTAIAAALPAVLDGWGFECGLDARDARIDFGALVSAASGGHRLLAHATAPRCARLVNEPGWSAVVRFCRAWAEPGSLPQRFVPCISLELECDQAPPDLPIPSVFVRLPTPWEVHGHGEMVIGALARTALELLRDQPLPTELIANLAHASAPLPAGGRILHVGLLMGREDQIRLSASIPRAGAQRYLSDIGLGDVATDVLAVADRYAPTKAIVEIHFELPAHGVPRLAIELPCQDHNREERARRFGALLDQLVSDGLAAPAKRDALLAWPTVEPLHLQQVAPGVLIREISYIKLVYQPDASLQAKAYLAVTPRIGRG